MVDAAAQADMAPPAMPPEVTAGPGAVAAGAVGPKLRLFFSAVNPRATQLGAVFAAIDDLGPRVDRGSGVEAGRAAPPELSPP